MLATVLFTDIVGSTERLVELGDATWRSIIARHDERARIEIERHRGRFIDSAGDGIFATFDGPARAVRCALAIMRSVEDLGIQIRAGVHTGEVELDGDAVRGIAVHVGARVSSLAGPSEDTGLSDREGSRRGLRTGVRGCRGTRIEGRAGPFADIPGCRRIERREG